MNRAQKAAWFSLTLGGIGIILSIPAVVILALKFGFPKALAGFAFISIIGFAGLSPLIFRKKPGEIDLDERDRMIQQKASWAGFGASYGFFGVVAMTTWFILGPDASISVNVLPRMFIGGMVAMIFSQSIATLIGYGRGGKNHE